MVNQVWLEKARDLRAEAYEELQASPAYAAFKCPIQKFLKRSNTLRFAC
jgi:hypothetical protein